MKKFTALILGSLLTVSFASCSKSEPAPALTEQTTTEAAASETTTEAVTEPTTEKATKPTVEYYDGLIQSR